MNRRKVMKLVLLLVFISTSCLQRSKDLKNDKQSEEDSRAKGGDEDQQGTGNNKSDVRDTSPKDPGNIFYYKYRFSNGGTTLAVKLDRKGDGNFNQLQVIDPSNNSAIDSIPLSIVPQAIPLSLHASIEQMTLFSGDSYTQKGFYRVKHNGELTEASINDVYNNPPKIMFTKFKRNNDINVVQQGSALQKLTASQWQQLAGQRPKVPSYTNPPPLPNNLQQWFDDQFNVGIRKLDKLEHNRAITIAGNTHYGTVYQLYDGQNECWGQIWGLDDVDVVRFLYNLKDNISLTYKNNSSAFSTVIDCRSSDDLLLTCRADLIKDQDLLQIVNGQLIVRGVDGSIGAYIDNQGYCHSGSP